MLFALSIVLVWTLFSGIHYFLFATPPKDRKRK